MSFFEEYKSSLKMIQVEEVLDVLFYRPVAFLLVKLILPTRIKPDHLTISAIIMGIISGFFYSLGTRNSCIYGALFFLVFNILDCSDGQLARLKKNGTPVGRIIDGIADYTAIIAVLTGIALGFSGKSEQPGYFMLLLVLSGLSIMIHGSLVDYYRTRFMDYVLGRKNTLVDGIEEYRKEYESIKSQKGKLFDRLIIAIYLKYSDLQRNLTSHGKSERLLNATPENYFRRNRVIIRFWVFTGPTMEITILAFCSMFCRFDLFFLITIVIFNIHCAVMWMIQQRIDKNFKHI